MSKLAKIKTSENESSIDDFIIKLDEQKQKDTNTIIKMMKKVTKEKPKMWGSSMIGFGKKIYKSPASGREVEWFKVGFSPRKSNFSFNLVMNIKAQAPLLKKLGKHKTGVGCLYVNKLEDVDLKVLEELIKTGLKEK